MQRQRSLSWALPVTGTMLAAAALLAGCQSAERSDRELESAFRELQALQEPPPEMPRTPQTPLVAAVPGLNVPFTPVGAAQFGDLTKMLARDGIPSFVVAYDEQIHPLSAVAGLYSGEHATSVTRVLPILSAAIEKENQIRRSQGVGDLQELVIVSYSQGSVLALDVLRRFVGFRDQWQDFLEQAGEEWNQLRADPELERFSDSAANFLLLEKIRLDRAQQYKRSYHFHRFYQRLSEDRSKASDRFHRYLTKPEDLLPNTTILPADQAGYPRRYPRIAQWLTRAPQSGSEVPRDFWMNYVEFEQLLPLQFRLFSMAGSFFGASTANVAVGALKVLPQRIDRLVGPIDGQLRDTQLGSRHHLEVIKAILAHSNQVGSRRAAENFYFVLGVNGNKGDGLVDEYSAHFSSHLFTQIAINELVTARRSEALSFEHQQLPAYPLTALKVRHLPRRRLLFFHQPGVAQMDEKSEVYPFLQAFIRKDGATLKQLHQDQHQRMRQFMVVLDLPTNGELDGYRFHLQAASRQVRIRARYYNRGSHALVWTGLVRSTKRSSSDEDATLGQPGEVLLKIFRGFASKAEVRLPVVPGTSHFVEILSEAGSASGEGPGGRLGHRRPAKAGAAGSWQLGSSDRRLAAAARSHAGKSGELACSASGPVQDGRLLRSRPHAGWAAGAPSGPVGGVWLQMTQPRRTFALFPSRLGLPIKQTRAFRPASLLL